MVCKFINMLAINYLYIIIFSAALFMSSPVSAYAPEKALANLSEDYGDCVVYYSLVVEMAKGMGEDDAIKKLQLTADNTLKVYLLTMENRTDKQIQSNLELHYKTNTKILKEEGMDRLILMYADQCKAMMENPDQRMQYWLNKK